MRSNLIKNRFGSNALSLSIKAHMNLIVQYSNLITFGNILTLITGIGSVATAVIMVYWKVKRVWLDQQYLFEQRLNERLDKHLEKLENCIHQIPDHPENPSNSIK